MKRDALYFALNETTHALRFIESAAKRFRTDPDELETGSGLASSVAYITNRLSDARESLAAAEAEIGRILQQAKNE
jgi:hypothetical protein